MDTLRRVPGGKWRYVNGRHQWFSDLRVENPAKYTGRTGRSFHLAYITEEEGRILNFLGMIQEWFSAMAQDDYRNEGEYSGLAPLSWISEPSHAVSMLVYITQNGANVLKRLDLHGSGVDKHDHFGPLGIPSYQGDGGGGGGGGRGGGGNGGGSGSGSSGGGFSGGGLNAGRSSASSSTGGLGNTGLGSGNTSAGANSNSGGGLSVGRSGSGLSLGKSASTGFGGSIGASVGTSATTASAAVASAVSSVAAAPKQTSFMDAAKTAFGIVGSIAGIATGTPMGVAGGLLGLSDAASKSGFSLGNFGTSGSTSIGGLSFGGNNGRNSFSLGSSGVSSRSNIGGAVLSPQIPSKTTGDVSPIVSGADSVSAETGGDVGNVRENSSLIKTEGFDIMGLAIPVLLFLLFKG